MLAERRAIAIALAAPFNAFPPDVVAGWTRLGARHNFPALRIQSQAVLQRHACKSAALSECLRVIDVEHSSDDALLVPTQANEWLANSIVQANNDALPRTRPPPTDISQKKLVKALRVAHEPKFRGAVHTRLTR